MHCATWSANPNTFFLFPIVPYHKITKRRNLDDNTKTTPPAASTKYTSFRSFDFHLIQLIVTPISITSTFRMSRAIVRAKISFRHLQTNVFYLHKGTLFLQNLSMNQSVYLHWNTGLVVRGYVEYPGEGRGYGEDLHVVSHLGRGEIMERGGWGIIFGKSSI